MAQALMAQAINAAKRALLIGETEVSLFGKTFPIVHAHHNEWQFLAPTGQEIFRMVKNGKSVQVLIV